MVSSIVERATSDMLIGPDWAMNMEICGMCNHDPQQAKDVVRGIKKRLGSKNIRVQLLTLTLLETLVKNCGDIVHMHVVEKDIPHDLVKIVKKKPDPRVKEKILILIDTWQEIFGTLHSRYPQYSAAYQELRRAGTIFPTRQEGSVPVLTPLQTQHMPASYQNLQNNKYHQGAAESSAEPDFPTLSLTEIQNARGIMDVLAEMLNALSPGNKEGLKQEVLVDLVEQCRMYKQRVVHLVNSTSDESLLCQGLTLNDDLQRLLANHEAISSGTVVQTEKEKGKSAGVLTDDSPLVDVGENKQSDIRSGAVGSLNQMLLLPEPPSTVNVSHSVVASDPKMDLLSGDFFDSPKAESSLAIVPAGGETHHDSPSHEKALVLFDMFSDGTSNPQDIANDHHNHRNHNPPPVQHQQSLLFSDGSDQRMEPAPPLHDQSAYVSLGQPEPQQPPSPPTPSPPPIYEHGSLPPPPWEAEPEGMQPRSDDQVVGMYTQPITSDHMPATTNHAAPGNQFFGYSPQVVPGPYMGFVPLQPPAGARPMHGSYVLQHGYGHQQGGVQYVQQRLYGLSVADDSAAAKHHSSFQVSRPEDKLFGDLVDIAKFKSSKNNP